MAQFGSGIRIRGYAYILEKKNVNIVLGKIYFRIRIHNTAYESPYLVHICCLGQLDVANTDVTGRGELDPLLHSQQITVSRVKDFVRLISYGTAPKNKIIGSGLTSFFLY